MNNIEINTKKYINFDKNARYYIETEENGSIINM